MRVTICQLPNQPSAFEHAWTELVRHARSHASELVVLPEMPFSPWLAATRPADQGRWNDSVARHDRDIETRLPELAPAAVLSSRPVVDDGVNYNRGFTWAEGQITDVHDKYYLPEEPGFWETDWYRRGDGVFSPTTVAGARVGFQICSEMWFFERGRAYGQQGVHIIASPRATGAQSVERWMTGGRALAITAGCFVLSCNLSAPCAADADLGGGSFAIDPDGQVLAVTTASSPFATLDLDPGQAEAARSTYPRYIAE